MIAQTETLRNTTEEKTSVRKICFVCTGNTCRSPMAAAVANRLAEERLGGIPAVFRSACLPDWTAVSAGLSAHEGDPISQNAADALRDAGMDTPEIKNHRAHGLTAQEADGYDLIVGMTGAHVLQLLLRFPALSAKITGMPSDIPDPYGGSPEVYRVCLEEIRKGVEQLLSEKERGKDE